MVFLVLAPLALAALAFADPSPRRRPLALLAGGAAAPGLPRRALGRRRPRLRLGGWLGSTRSGSWSSPPPASSSSSAPSTRRATCARRSDRDNRVFVGGLLVLLSAMTRGRALAAPRADLGRHRGSPRSPPRRSSTSTTTPARSRRPGSTCSSARSGSRWRCSAPSSWPTPAPARAGRARCSSRTWCGQAPGSPRRGCTPRSSSCSSATARRWASRRCTPGSPTPTARRPASWGRSSPGASPACAFLALARVVQICAAAGEGRLRP